MKKNTLTSAVLAGLTGAVGLVGAANAVNVNPDGLGQVLIYPYYTVQAGNNTLISVVNTTSQAKSVKVRFLEALNSTEVLDFNLYLSEFDVWTAALGIDEETGGAVLATGDTSCTVPYIFGDFGGIQEFLTFELENDGGPTDVGRTTSGYIEMIEMGVLTDETKESATAATHVGGVPNNCGQLVDAWTEILVPGADDPDNYWIGDPTIDHAAPSGGLFGSGTIVNPDAGQMFTYNATAIDNFRTAQIHTNPGFLNPSLLDAQGNSVVFQSGAAAPITSSWSNSGGGLLDGILAVNAVLTHDTIMNEYVLGGAAAAVSEWVATFPTKRPHVQSDFDEDGEALDDPIPPFTDVWDGTGACEVATVARWDREEGPDPEDPESEIRPPRVSPLPPPEPGPQPEPPFQICFEANVIRFTDVEDDTPASTEILGAPLDNGTGEQGYVNFDTGGLTEGWARFTFDQVSLPDDSGMVYTGLPVVGFWVNTFARGELVVDGALTRANFGGSFNHRATRQITAIEAQ